MIEGSGIFAPWSAWSNECRCISQADHTHHTGCNNHSDIFNTCDARDDQ